MPLVTRDPFRMEWPEWFTKMLEERWPEGMATVGGMRVEELSEDDTYVVKVELPGIDPDKDVELSIHDGVLDIRAERREEKREEKGAGYRTEFRYGAFTRRLPLPPGASEADVKATYKDGILEVRLPIRKPEERTAKIPIQRD